MAAADGRKIALVTGAARGVGRATALRLANDRFVVAVNDIADDERLGGLADSIGGLALPADISGANSADEMVSAISDRLGDWDVLVANAAAMETGSFFEQPADRWWRQIEVNLSGHFRLVQAAVPPMRRAGGGRIVVLSSGWGVVGHPNATAYAASKAGLVALVKGLGRELAPQGILANAIAPAFIDTDQLQVDDDDAGVTLAEIRDLYRAQVPTGELSHAEDVAAVVAFLCSDGAGSFVGQVLQPSGGVTRTRA